MSPEEFHGIELRSIRGKPFDSEPILVGLDFLDDDFAAMGGETVHEKDEWRTPVFLQGPDEPSHLRSLDASLMQGEEPANASAVRLGEHAGDTRQGMPVERLAEDRRPAFRCPGRSDRRTLGKSRFVEEAQPRFQTLGVFFTSGQRSRTHLMMAFSSRSMALRAGRWRLKAQRTQDAPDMVRMIVHAAGFLDDLGDSVQRPEVSLESPVLRSLFEGGLKTHAVSLVKSRHSSGAASATQSFPSLTAPYLIPPMGTRTTHVKTADDLRLGFALTEKGRGLEPADLQGLEVAPKPKCGIHASSLR